MKKIMLIAAVAAMTASGGAWAACTADIDMGDNKIQNLGAPMADSDAATKAYVDAVGRLEVSPVTNLQVSGFLGAAQLAGGTSETVERQELLADATTCAHLCTRHDHLSTRRPCPSLSP